VDTLLHAALSNAAVVAILAPLVSVFARFQRRPALVHSLWLLVLLKLFTPPLWPVPLSWLVHSDAYQAAANDRAGAEPGLPAESVETAALTPAVPERAEDGLQAMLGPDLVASAPVEPASRLSEQAAASPAASVLEPSAPAVPAAVFSWRAWLAGIWLSGSGVWLVLAGWRIARFRRLLRLTQRAPPGLQMRVRRLAQRLGLTGCPDVGVVPASVSPLVWALGGAPRLLVPESLLHRLSEEQWDTLLAHELAHLRRGDHWVRLLELACFGLYWWHPVVWWARRELREAEEQCCDAWVVWALPDAAEAYASALVEVVAYLSSARTALPLAASGIGQMHPLKRRLTMIMRGTTPRALSAAGSLAVLGLAAVLLPVYPSWARTERAGEGTDDRPASGDTAPARGRAATDGERLGGPGDQAPDRPVPGAVARPRGGRFGPDPDGAVAGFGRGIAGGREHAETIDDAQDDLDLLKVQLQLRQAERREVEARLRQAQNDKNRLSQLATTNSVDRSEVQRATTEVEVQEARLAAKNAQIQEAELRLRQAARRLAKLRESPPATETRIGATAPVGGGGGNAPGLSGGSGVSGTPQGQTPQRGPGGGRFGGFGGSSGSMGSAGSSGSAPLGGESGGQRRNFGQGGAGGGGIPQMGGFPGGIAATPASFDRRLREVEQKLQSLIDEMKALRKDQPVDRSPAKK